MVVCVRVRAHPQTLNSSYFVKLLYATAEATDKNPMPINQESDKLGCIHTIEHRAAMEINGLELRIAREISK